MRHQVGQNVRLGFSIWWLQQCLVVFNFIQNSFDRLYCDSYYITVHFKKLTKIGDFSCSHFNMEENMQHFWQYCALLFQERQKRKKIYAVYGEDAVTDRTCPQWFVKFHAVDFSLDNASWSHRPVEVDSDQIETLIENNQHYTTQERADILKISKSTNLLVKVKNTSFISQKKTKWTFWPTQYFGTGSLQRLSLSISPSYM